LAGRAAAFVDDFDANSYLQLSRSMDLYVHGDQASESSVARGSLERALVIGVRSDLLFVASEQVGVATELAKMGVDVELMILESDYGHDAFLVDHAAFAHHVRRFMRVLDS
jgi:homoserine O-acetyltransferase/O-succinyltransferase